MCMPWGRILRYDCGGWGHTQRPLRAGILRCVSNVLMSRGCHVSTALHYFKGHVETLLTQHHACAHPSLLPPSRYPSTLLISPLHRVPCVVDLFVTALGSRLKPGFLLPLHGSFVRDFTSGNTRPTFNESAFAIGCRFPEQR